MKRFVFCMGVECAVRNQCKRFTEYSHSPIIRKCTNQKLFLQDGTKVNGDSQRR